MQSKRRPSFLVLVWICMVTMSNLAKALEIDVTVNSSAIAAATAGNLDFQLNGGAGAQPLSVTISNFTPTSLTLGSIVLDGDASGGPLPTNVTITNATAFNAALQEVTFGASSGFTFRLTFSGAALTTTGTSGSTFSLSLIGPEPEYASLLPGIDPPHLDILIPGSGQLGVPQITSNYGGISAVVVPEPGTITFAIAGAIAAILAHRRSRIGSCKMQQSGHDATSGNVD